MPKNNAFKMPTLVFKMPKMVSNIYEMDPKNYFQKGIKLIFCPFKIMLRAATHFPLVFIEPVSIQKLGAPGIQMMVGQFITGAVQNTSRYFGHKFDTKFLSFNKN